MIIISNIHVMEEKELHELKQELWNKVSELRLCFDRLHKGLEWAEMPELYSQASAVYRMIERLEEIVRKL